MTVSRQNHNRTQINNSIKAKFLSKCIPWAGVPSRPRLPSAGMRRGFIAIGDKVNGTYKWHVEGGIYKSIKMEIYEIICRELPNTPKFIVNLFR